MRTDRAPRNAAQVSSGQPVALGGVLILGVDPGLLSCGWGLTHFAPRPRLVEGGTIHTPAGLPVEERLHIIGMELRRHRADAIAWEKQSGVHHGKQNKGHTNAKALEVLKVEGLFVGICLEWGCLMLPVTAQRAKMATGLGAHASKQQVKSFVDALPKGPAWPKRFSQHCADGVAISLAGKLRIGRRYAPTLR